MGSGSSINLNAKRTADYTIEGFLYQFNKTLLEILSAADDAEITIEGVIEDIEISSPTGTKAVQCKYHETKDQFVLSAVYKPILQMMQHFHQNPDSEISYVLFAHFANPPIKLTLGQGDIETILKSSNKDLKSYCAALQGNLDISKFLNRFAIEFGPRYDDLVACVQVKLVEAGVAREDVETLAYPNALQIIATLSINHDAAQRKIKKQDLVATLRTIKSTAITHWTLGLKTKRQLLVARKGQLKGHLCLNSRLRHFVINCASLVDFDAEFVTFVCDFLNRYHFKIAHIHTPLFCLETKENIFKDIQRRLYRKGVVSEDGLIGGEFEQKHFFRDPLIMSSRGKSEPKREFNVRLLQWQNNGATLSYQKPNDLFVIGPNSYTTIDTKDVCVEQMEPTSVKELSFLFGLRNTYE